MDQEREDAKSDPGSLRLQHQRGRDMVQQNAELERKLQERGRRGESLLRYGKSYAFVMPKHQQPVGDRTLKFTNEVKVRDGLRISGCESLTCS